MEPQYWGANRDRLSKLYIYIRKLSDHGLHRNLYYTKYIRSINNLRQKIIDLRRNPPNQRKLRIEIQFSELRKINFILRQYRRCVGQNFNKFRFKIIDRRIKPLNFYQKIELQYFLSQRVKLPLSKTKTKRFEDMKVRHDTPIFQEKDDDQTLSSQSIGQGDNFDTQSQDNQSINSDNTQQFSFYNRRFNQVEQMRQMQQPRQRRIEIQRENQIQREIQRESEKIKRNYSCQKSNNIQKKSKNRPILQNIQKVIKYKRLSLQKISQQNSSKQSSSVIKSQGISSVIKSLATQSLQFQVLDDQQSHTQEIKVAYQNLQAQNGHNIFRSAFR